MGCGVRTFPSSSTRGVSRRQNANGAAVAADIYYKVRCTLYNLRVHRKIPGLIPTISLDLNKELGLGGFWGVVA